MGRPIPTHTTHRTRFWTHQNLQSLPAWHRQLARRPGQRTSLRRETRNRAPTDAREPRGRQLHARRLPPGAGEKRQEKSRLRRPTGHSKRRLRTLTRLRLSSRARPIAPLSDPAIPLSTRRNGSPHHTASWYVLGVRHESERSRTWYVF